MTEKEAISILAQVANIAQEKGILKLSDAVIVSNAIDTLIPPQTQDETQPLNNIKKVDDETVN